jgi:hypothetical protein
VHHLVDAGQRAADRLGVADVADEQLGVLGEVVGALTGGVHLRVQDVEHPDAVPALEQLGGQVGADEAGATGDQDGAGHDVLLQLG